MWTGEGYKRTRRILGVTAFVAAFGLEAGFHVGLPTGIYVTIGGLLGLDVLTGVLNEWGPPGERRQR